MSHLKVDTLPMSSQPWPSPLALTSLALLVISPGLMPSVSLAVDNSPSLAPALAQTPAEQEQELALQLGQQVLELFEAERYEEVIPLAEQLLVIWEKLLGAKDISTAEIVRVLAFSYQNIGRYDQAEPLYQRTLAITEQARGSDHPDTARSLDYLALLYQLQGRYSEAEPFYQRALAIREKALGPDHPDTAESLNGLAVVYTKMGRYAEAEPLYQRALAIREKALGPNHPDTAKSLNGLASGYSSQGRYSEAEPLYRRALAIREKALGPDHPDTAESLNRLASVYADMGRYTEAEPLYQRALAIREKALGLEHPDTAQSLNGLAVVYQYLGRYTEAETLYQRALAIREKVLGLEHLDTTQPLNNLVRLYESQDRYAQALNNLAVLYTDMGRYVEAEPLYQKALAIREKVLGPDHPDTADSLNYLANFYASQGRYSQAEPLYQRALAIREKALGPDHPSTASSLNNLAFLYQSQGRYSQAEPLYQRALTIKEKALGPDHPDTAGILNNLAVLYASQGRYSEAVASLSQGLTVEERNLDLNLATLPEPQRQAYLATISGTGQIPISLHLQAAPTSPAAAQLALTTLLRRKGRLLDAGTDSRRRLRQNLTPDDQVTLDQLTDSQRQLAALVYNPPPQLPPAQYRARFAQLEAQVNGFEATLARRSAAFRAETLPVTLAAVQAQIPADGVLVEFTRYRPYSFTQATNRSNRWGGDRYAAYLLFPNGRIEAVDLGAAQAIDNAVQAFGRLLQDPGADLRGQDATINVKIDPARITEVTSSVRTLVFGPLAPLLQGRQHLLISADSQLNRLPFEALLTEDGQYLVERYRISYLNTGRDLLRFGIAEASTASPVILANPDYNATTPRGSQTAATAPRSGVRAAALRSSDLSQLQVDPLPGTAAEAQALEQLFSQATVLTQAAATETALKQVKAPQILHIATHGFFLADAPVAPPADSRGVELAGPDGFRAAAALSTVVENPLLRSGLALAGFNRRRSGSEDGVFTALEASGLDLFGTQLVVLSACDTGLGDLANGQGVYGLRRAFDLAGAETQMLSLWPVSDQGTQRLMTRYYQKLMAGLGRSEALRAVQLEMIRGGGDQARPYYWAAFILAGNWRALGQ
ncbi:MAG: tetratricopeptide repeat protein [Nodosilinea sp.]